jgi:hypothetical protein
MWQVPRTLKPRPRTQSPPAEASLFLKTGSVFPESKKPRDVAGLGRRAEGMGLGGLTLRPEI